LGKIARFVKRINKRNQMKNQTAVGWLLDQLEKKGDIRETPSIRNLQLNIDTSDYVDLKRQAKAMEKEQIVNAACEFMGTTFDPNKGRAELYYNETYGGDK
jgi:hypothetical protein